MLTRRLCASTLGCSRVEQRELVGERARRSRVGSVDFRKEHNYSKLGSKMCCHAYPPSQAPGVAAAFSHNLAPDGALVWRVVASYLVLLEWSRIAIRMLCRVFKGWLCTGLGLVLGVLLQWPCSGVFCEFFPAQCLRGKLLFKLDVMMYSLIVQG